MSIRSVLRVVASTSDRSTYLADSEGNTLPGWGTVGLLGQLFPSYRHEFMQEGKFPPNHIRGKPYPLLCAADTGGVPTNLFSQILRPARS
jgi:hypothetical protein